MRNIALKIMYDGGIFHGWQRQKNAVSVQECMEKALAETTGELITVTGCSRTDAGVHAREFVLNFKSTTRIPIEKLPYAVNYRLPSEISALEAWEAEDNFSARFSARGKRYQYRIWNAKIANPFESRYSWQIPYKLDVEAMKQAAPFFEGKKDFAGFMAAGGDQKTTVRTVRQCMVWQDPKQAELITVTVEADAFLYNMVRIITGTLAEVGFGKIDNTKIPEIIESKDRTRGGLTAPPQGLFLEKVFYDG